MTTLTESAVYGGEFIVSEANGTRSRETATVASGQDLVAGQIVQLNGSGKLIAADGTLDTAGDVATAPAGVLFAAVDATSADVTARVYIARDAEVKGDLITYPTESTAGGEEEAYIEALAALGIIVR